MKNTFLSLVALGLLLGSTNRLLAQDAPKPVLVVSVSSYDELLKDIDYVGALIDKPNMAQTIEGLLGFFTAQQGLAGLDKSKPWGAVVATDGNSFPKAVFLPVSDLPKLLGALQAFVSEPKDAGDGVLEVEVKANAMPLFLKAKNGWAYIGQSTADLATLPEDPTTLLAGLDKQYDIGIRAFVQNVPEIYRQLAVSAITDGVEKNMQRLPDEDDAAYEQRKKFAQAQLQAVVTSINDIDQLTVGISIDRDAKKVALDFGSTVVAGSASAAQLADNKDLKSQFGGFFDSEALFGMATTSKLDAMGTEQALAQLAGAKAQLVQELNKSEEFPSDEAKAQVISIVSDGFDLFGNMIKSGRMDLGISVVGTGPVTLLVGGHVGDGAAVPPLVEKIAKLVEMEGHLASFEKDVAKVGDVTFHKLALKAPEGGDADKVAKLLGPGDIQIFVGVGKESAYVAAGGDGMKHIQAAIAKSAAAADSVVMPVQMTVSVASILKLALLADDSKPELADMAAMLQEAGNGHVRLLYKPLPNGAMAHLEIEEGVIRVLGKVGANRQVAPGF